MSESDTRGMPFDEDSTIENLDDVFDHSPTQIGPFKILAKLGEGGFGVVYEAQQEEPVKRRVALKVIKPGMDSKKVIARFEAERQALALMTHQNIAKVLGGGLTDRGLPYFVMELVKGEPITDFCDRNKMTLEDRLKLLIPVCHAVQHAHAKSVIHRDLKPSNILVGYNAAGEPTPTVIDFGVAKALHQQLTEKTIYTQEGQMIGTPEYMSPEQAEMSGVDIDTRTDVYSLGVVLYELLTGMLPFEPSELRGKMYAEMQRLIREQAPPRPSNRLSSALSTMNLHDDAVNAAKSRHMSESELPKHLRGELDWVVMKCLEKDRDRRYPTPIALAEEIQHYLNNEPVLARPPSASYRFNKLIKRNKAPVAAMLIFAATLVIATGVSVRLSIIAKNERRIAERSQYETLVALEDKNQALSAERTQRNIAEAALNERNNALTSERKQRELAQIALADREFALDSERKQREVAESRRLDAEASLSRARAAEGLAKMRLGELESTLESIFDNMDNLVEDGNISYAEPLAEEAVRVIREVFSSQHPKYYYAITSLATIYNRQG